MQYAVVIEKTGNGCSAYVPECRAASPPGIHRRK